MGLPARPFVRVCRSVIVNSPESTPGEYVVGTAAWNARGPVGALRPGTPACCSVKKATALPQSTTAPPPKVTIPSAPSPWTAVWAARTESTGRCGSTPANVDASDLPTRPVARAVVTRSATGTGDEHHTP